MTRIALIAPGAPPEDFPPAEASLDEPEGLLAAGGDLSPERLMYAYRHGIFPWFEADQPILWWCPHPRMVLLPENFHVSRSLRRTMRSGDLEFSIDQACSQVIRACANTREETWITPGMFEAYIQLHHLGHVHSIETWESGRLVGGLYGVHIGAVFFGESMFSIRTDASKVAAAALCQLAGELGIELIDCQLANPHLETLGAHLMDRNKFLERIGRLTQKVSRAYWARAANTTACLA